MDARIIALGLLVGGSACVDRIPLDVNGSTGGQDADAPDPPRPTTSTSSTTSPPPDPDDGDTGGGDDSGGDSGSPFIQDPDGGSGSIQCDIWAQDCAPGEKCMPWANDGGNSWNATRCTPIAESPGQEGDPCTVVGSGVSGVDDCDIGSMCWDVDPETDAGYCVEFCVGSEAGPLCNNPSAHCNISCDGVLTLCLPGCDPLLQDCYGDDVCIATASGDGFACVLDASGEEGQYLDPCEYANVCDPGLFCASADAVPDCQGSFGCCTPYCDLSDPACPADTECISWFAEGMAPPGHDNVGACVAVQP